MNPLSRLLPGLVKKKADPATTPFDELPRTQQLEILAKEKAERIKFHRERVRNGPWNKVRNPLDTQFISRGRHESRVRRGERVQLRKQNQRHRRDFMRAQSDVSRLRGQLITVAAIPTSSGSYRVGQTEAAMRNAWVGLFDGYGDLVAETLGVEKLDVEFRKHREAVAEAAVHHYELAIGARR